MYAFAALVLAFLFLPSLIVVPMSVTDSIFLSFPPKGFTWAWYQDYFHVGGCCHFSAPIYWMPTTIISIELAIAVILVAVPLGALAAYGLARGRFWGRDILNAIIISPLIVPILITAVALFFFLVKDLRSFLGPPTGLPVPVWGEYALIFLAIALGITAVGLLLFKTFYRKPMKEWDSILLLWYERSRPWAPVTLLLTAAYLLIPWLSGWTSRRSEALLSPEDPYPEVPMISAGLLVGHVMLALPFVTVVLSATLRNVGRNQDQVAAILGAGPVTTLTRVVLPQMKPGLAVAAIFAALISFNELLMALFLSSSRVGTLPKEIWYGIWTEISPTIAAVFTMLVILTVILLGAAFLMMAKSGRRKGETCEAYIRHNMDYKKGPPGVME